MGRGHMTNCWLMECLWDNQLKGGAGTFFERDRVNGFCLLFSTFNFGMTMEDAKRKQCLVFLEGVSLFWKVAFERNFMNKCVTAPASAHWNHGDRQLTNFQTSGAWIFIPKRLCSSASQCLPCPTFMKCMHSTLWPIVENLENGAFLFNNNCYEEHTEVKIFRQHAEVITACCDVPNIIGVAALQCCQSTCKITPGFQLLTVTPKFTFEPSSVSKIVRHQQFFFTIFGNGCKERMSKHVAHCVGFCLKCMVHTLHHWITSGDMRMHCWEKHCNLWSLFFSYNVQ